jgi:hypothetical protein
MYQQLQDQSRHHVRSSRRNDRLIREYSDLTTGEIRLLTKILSHAPKQRNSPNANSYERIVQEKTSRLPSHLRARIPWLSTFCSLHSKIVPWPVKSILEWLKDEIDTFLPEVWSPLRTQRKLNEEQQRMLIVVENLRCLWTPSESQQTKSRQHRPSISFGYGSAKCSGCVLAQIGGNGDVLIAIGALFIGRVRGMIWKRSKRIVWIESWIRDAVEDSQADQAVHMMWQLGMELREVRKKANASDRSYVDEYAAEARAADQGQAQKQPTQTNPFDDSNWLDQDVTADDLFDRGLEQGEDQNQSMQHNTFESENWLAQVATADELFNNQEEWDQLQPPRQVETESASEEQAGAGLGFGQDFETDHLFRPSSSVYSRRSDRSRASSHDSTDQLIEMYRHSKYTMNGRPF